MRGGLFFRSRYIMIMTTRYAHDITPNLCSMIRMEYVNGILLTNSFSEIIEPFKISSRIKWFFRYPKQPACQSRVPE